MQGLGQKLIEAVAARVIHHLENESDLAKEKAKVANWVIGTKKFNCPRPCVVCSGPLLDNCSKRCCPCAPVCFQWYCTSSSDEGFECTSCGVVKCDDCANPCSECNLRSCKKCQLQCHDCTKRICIGCWTRCADCKNLVCPNCRGHYCFSQKKRIKLIV